MLFLPLFPNSKTQTLSSPRIVYIGLVLYSELFGNKFALICGSVVLMLNLIIIIIVIDGEILSVARPCVVVHKM